MDCSLLGSSVHGILQSRIWSVLPFHSPRDHLNTGIKPRSPALQANSLQSEPPGSPISMVIYYSLVKFYCRDLDIIRQKLAVNWVYFVKMNKELKFIASESEVAQLCPTHFDPMDCSSPGSSFHGIVQARVLEWVAISFSRGSSWPTDRTQVSCIIGRCFTIWATYMKCSSKNNWTLNFKF